MKAFDLNLLQVDAFTEILANTTGNFEYILEDKENYTTVIITNPQEAAEALSTYDGRFNNMAQSIIDGLKFSEG